MGAFPEFVITHSSCGQDQEASCTPCVCVHVCNDDYSKALLPDSNKGGQQESAQNIEDNLSVCFAHMYQTLCLCRAMRYAFQYETVSPQDDKKQEQHSVA